MIRFILMAMTKVLFFQQKIVVIQLIGKI